MQAIKNTANTEENHLMKAFGLVLRNLRQDHGLSQEELGFKSGYHRTYISLLERGRKSPSLQTIFDLSVALNIDPVELIKQVRLESNALLRNAKRNDD